MGKGRGWHGERRKHSLAAQGVSTKPHIARIQALLPASAADMRLAEKVRAAISATEESPILVVSVNMENAVEWMEEVTYGPKYEGASVSKGELRKAYGNIDRLMTNAIKAEPNVGRKKQLRDVRTAARIAKGQL